MDKKISIKLWRSTWDKILVCIGSRDTSIDTDGSWNYVYLINPETGRPKKNKAGEDIKLFDKETKKPLTERVEFDSTIKFWKAIKEIKKQLAKETS